MMDWQKINYEPGTLRAVGIRDGKAVCEDVLMTAGKAAALQVESDATVTSQGEIVHVVVQSVDSAGLPVFHEELELEFSVEGGEILALDNGELTADDDLRAKKKRKTKEGRCLCILRAGKESGKMILKVKAKGLSSAIITVDVK